MKLQAQNVSGELVPHLEKKSARLSEGEKEVYYYTFHCSRTQLTK